MVLEWSEKYAVGVDRFDSEHKRLIALINDLNTAMAESRGKEEIGRTLSELVDYTKIHFGGEESLMRDHHYPGYNAHKEEHDKLTAQVLEFEREFEAGSMALSFKIMRFLRDWLGGHIQVTDKKYGPFFNERGIG